MEAIATLFIFVAVVLSIWAFNKFLAIHEHYREKIQEYNLKIDALNAESERRNKQYDDWQKLVRQYGGAVYIWQAMQGDDYLDTTDGTYVETE